MMTEVLVSIRWYEVKQRAFDLCSNLFFFPRYPSSLPYSCRPSLKRTEPTSTAPLGTNISVHWLLTNSFAEDTCLEKIYYIHMIVLSIRALAVSQFWLHRR